MWSEINAIFLLRGCTALADPRKMRVKFHHVYQGSAPLSPKLQSGTKAAFILKAAQINWEKKTF